MSHSWPKCSNSTDAKFGTFAASNCEGMLIGPLYNREDIHNVCMNIRSNMVSMSFWCDGPIPLPYQEPPEEQRKGGMIKYPYASELCAKYESQTPKPEYHAAHTCVDIIKGNGLISVGWLLVGMGRGQWQRDSRGQDVIPQMTL